MLAHEPQLREVDALQLRLENVEKSFLAHGRTIKALGPISLSVKPREFVALVGPSGCGKSTVLNLVAGLIRPTIGAVFYGGKEVTQINRQVGYLTQRDTLLPWRNVVDNIGISLELKCRAIGAMERRDKVQEIIDLIGLRGFERHYPGELSGGMRRRVAMARTLIYEPETLLMDEPFGALDAQLKLVMQDQLQQLTQMRGMTVLFVTHDLGEAIALADRVLVFSARPGQIRALREIPLPRPRDIFNVRFAGAFSRMHEELWNELKDQVRLGTDI